MGVDIHVLILNLVESTQSIAIEYDFNCAFFFINAFHQVEEVPFYSKIVNSFNLKVCHIWEDGR